MTKKQLEYVIEISKLLGLGLLSACAADFFFGADHLIVDVLGVLIAASLLYVGFRLTRYLGGDSL
ncbi:MAG: hypothetical protein HYY13_12775 [Nitrospirae bacterium]|nr:hypothetical protein [Nitrospirota bacterium]